VAAPVQHHTVDEVQIGLDGTIDEATLIRLFRAVRAY
jgi:hypothetical protein